MRMAPVGLYHALSHDQPWQRGDGRGAFDMGCDFAALTHGHPTGYLAAGAFAATIGAVASGVTLPEALEIATCELIRREHHEETLAAIQQAVFTANSGARSADVTESLGGGWVAEEALAIGI